MITCNDCIHSIICDRDIRETGCTCSAFLEERPHGEWVLDQEFSFVFNIYECSKCRFNGSKRWHFCPSCGARMTGEGEVE